MNPQFFRTSQRVSDAIMIGRNLSNYIKREGVENVIFLDRSARPAYIPLKNAWKKKFPKLKLPNIYFTNNEGYNTNNRSVEEIVDEFDRTYSRLSSDKTSKILLFDVCIHSGSTLKPVLNVLEQAGYTEILVGLANPPHNSNGNKHSPDFVALRNGSDNLCYPFERDNMVRKNRTSVVSSRNNNEGDRLESTRLRKELSSFF